MIKGSLQLLLKVGVGNGDAGCVGLQHVPDARVNDRGWALAKGRLFAEGSQPSDGSVIERHGQSSKTWQIHHRQADHAASGRIAATLSCRVVQQPNKVGCRACWQYRLSIVIKHISGGGTVAVVTGLAVAAAIAASAHVADHVAGGSLLIMDPSFRN